ncbi:MAG: hypothetical protein AUJ55_11710 [Proteobacteria bacterium CG1_02_64_396]|nr:MAG: hypothetical protein AUJ55_11710 [Proteobacteria bacterium CG1_02_64_396]
MAARQRFRRVGRSINAFARDLRVHPNTVHEILSGRKKGLRGDAHKVAVVLGLKEGEILPDEVSTVDAVKGDAA